MKTINFQGHLWKAEKSRRGGDYAILRRKPSKLEVKSVHGCITALEVKISDLKGYNRADVINLK